MDFNSGEFGPSGDEPEQNSSTVQVDNIVNDLFGAQLVASSDTNADDESYMQEADKRIGIAQYYRELIRGSIFTGPKTDESKVVEREIKNFCKGRLHILLSMNGQAPAEIKSPFSDNEIKILKILATWSEAEINILRSIISRVTQTAAAPKPSIETKPAAIEAKPQLVKLTTGSSKESPVSPAPQQEKPPAQPTRRGRPAKEKVYETKIDPMTGKEVKSLVVEKQVNPMGIPFPSAAAMAQITTARAAEAAAKASEVHEVFVAGIR